MDELTLFWQPCPGGARLVRVMGQSPCITLPDQVEGLPIVEIGSYCFAPRTPRPKGAVRVNGAEFPALIEALEHRPGTALCGNFLESVRLPAPLTTLDSAAFYDCRKLNALTLYPALRRLGSDEFTNCFALTTLHMMAELSASTGLSRVLGAIQTAVSVAFLPAPAATPAALFHYPEFAEILSENGPAHLFNHHIQGVGYLYRQCFDGDGRVKSAEYDSAFPRALAEEFPETLCRIAFSRLRCPAGLGEAARQDYRTCCRNNGEALAKLLLSESDSAGLEFACREALLTPDAQRYAAALAAKQDNPQAAALLLNWRHKSTAPKSKRYDFGF